MDNLQETLERIYQQRKQPKQPPKLSIRGVIITQKELKQLSASAKTQMFLVS